MTEQDIQRKMIKALENEYDAYVVKVISANKAGVPDILACINGKFIGIEVKRPETKHNVSKLQAHNLSMIEQAEGIATVCWSVDDLREFIEEEVL
jgi:Holliday junction resolvase